MHLGKVKVNDYGEVKAKIPESVGYVVEWCISAGTVDHQRQLSLELKV